MGAATLTAELERLGLESERRHLRCWLGGAPAANAAEGRKLLRRRADGPRSLAVRGGVLSALGDFEAARAALDEAARALPEESAVRAWRGEISILLGRPDAALADLDAAIERGAGYHWAHAYRAAARWAVGDAAGAERDADALLKRLPRSAAACALKAILEAQKGSKTGASKWLDKALERGSEGWLFALRGSLRSKWDDLDGARRDMDRALAAENSPWVRLERARVVNQMGEFWEALKDLKAASRALPDSPEVHFRAGSIHLDQAQYRQAIDRFSRAQKLDPSSVAIRRMKARAYSIQGRLSEAQAELDAASALAPQDVYLKQECLQLRAVRGYDRQVEAALREPGWPAGTKEFWLGYLHCRRRRYAQAAKFFDAARGLCPDETFREKALHYGWVARILRDGPALPPAKSKELHMLGLGYRQPFQACAQTVRVLAASDVIYSNLSDQNVADFLGLFPIPFRAIVFRSTMQQAGASSRKTIAGFGAFKRIAMVTRGQPVVYGRLAWRLVQGAKREGAGAFCAPSTTIFDNLTTLIPGDGAWSAGLQVRDSHDVGGLDPRYPAVVYLPVFSDRIVERLMKIYPRKHPCYLMPGSGEREFAAPQVPLARLREALARADRAATLFLPAASAR